MPAAYVRPYVKRQKNDATDAEAICEAVTRANMRFVETKTPSSKPPDAPSHATSPCGTISDSRRSKCWKRDSAVRAALGLFERADGDRLGESHCAWLLT